MGYSGWSPCCWGCRVRCDAQDVASALRAPAVPLIPVDPYFSVWATADRLTENQPDGKPGIAHWTGAANPLTSLVNVDGKTYRIMGAAPAEIPAMDQKSLKIQPTTVTYTFEGAGIRVALEFMTPLLPEDLMVISRPITYLTWNVNSIDGKEHAVKVYFDDTADLVVNDVKKEKVAWSVEKFGNVDAVKVGSVDQPVLKLKGDRVRINWGYSYVAAPASENGKLMIGAAREDARAPGAMHPPQQRTRHPSWPAKPRCSPSRLIWATSARAASRALRHAGLRRRLFRSILL